MGERFAFVGLGVMGYPMAGHLARAGHDVTVFNRTTARAAQWVAEYGGSHAASPGAAAEGARAVFVCVGRDQDVRDVVLSSGAILSRMASGGVLVDHTTASADLARQLSTKCATRGLDFVDAPVSGGQSGAQAGSLTAFCGGTKSAFEAVAPWLASYCSTATLLGPTGSGQLAKMVNQICIAGLLQGLAEGLHFLEMAGLDPAEVIPAIAQGAAQSWQLDNRGQTMIAGEFEHGFAVEWMRKDLQLAIREARRNGAQLPVTALVDQFYADVQGLGGSRWDTSSLIARLRALSGPVR